MKTNPVKSTRLLFVAAGLALTGNLPAATVAWWDFEDGVDGQAFTPSGDPNGSGGSTDTVNGILMRGFNTTFGPSFTSLTSPGGGSLAMNNANNGQDGYVTEGALHNWSSGGSWTIETHVYLEEIAGWETLIGRDGTTGTTSESDFYLANNGIDDRFRINYVSAGGTRWILDGGGPPESNTWYGLAARSDGSELTLWLDDGTGYAQVGALDISAQSPADNALASSNLNWTFGRGWFGGSFVDHIDGRMDNIRFSDSALTPGEMIAIPEVSSLGLLALAGLGTLRRRRG